MNSLQDRGQRDRSRPQARVVSAPEPGSDGEGVGVRLVLGPHTGFAALEQTLLACDAGRSLARDTGECEEVLFVLAGEGVLRVGGEAHRLEPESGAYLPPEASYELEAAGAGGLRVVAVRVPDPDPVGGDAVAMGSATGSEARATVRRLADQELGAATTEREFRIVADPASGLRSATQFVGYIPPLRAPAHFHTYDEVIYVLDGEGVMHIEGSDHPLEPGSSIQLPARTVHCLENTGDAVMRVVAVFRPAGSPAAAYYPDGTPAYAGEK